MAMATNRSKADDGPDDTAQFAASHSVDAFHHGGFYLVQPEGKGHRAGLDAMLLAALVPDDAAGRLADLGAGAGAAGFAVANRVADLRVALIERSALMVECASRSMELPQNRHLASRISVLQADVALGGRARIAAGLADSLYDHVIMNPPFNDSTDRTTPDNFKAEAHAMTDQMFSQWIRTACAIARPGGQLSLIARPHSLAEIISACDRRFGGLQVTPVHPRPGHNAIRILLTAIKASRARLALCPPLFVHDGTERAFSARVEELSNGRASLKR